MRIAIRGGRRGARLFAMLFVAMSLNWSDDEQAGSYNSHELYSFHSLRVPVLAMVVRPIVSVLLCEPSSLAVMERDDPRRVRVQI
jgi:hypothetical protein